MLVFVRSVVLYLMINLIRIVSLVSIQELTTNDIIVNVNKGYALRHLGTYSSNFKQQTVHTFIPLNDFCDLSPKADVCMYSSLKMKANILELMTMISSNHISYAFSKYDRDTVSELNTKDITQVLTQHRPDVILRDIKSSTHFINNQFRYLTHNDTPLPPASSISSIDNYNDTLRFRATPIDMIIKQINNNRINFEYLSGIELRLFLTAVFSSIDTSYTIINIEESLNTFMKLVIGQSIYALRYCATDRQNSLPSQPCLAISTLFLRIPTDTASTYSTYRLIPLPTVYNEHIYIYSNLPKVVAINSIDQRLIVWNDELDTNQCMFSSIVLCQKQPISTSLLESSCLFQLLDNNQLYTNMCQVSRSLNIEEHVINIDEGVWLFFNIRQTHYCQLYSTSDVLTETISVSESSVVRMPCEMTVKCASFELPASPCRQHRMIVTPNFNWNIARLTRFIVPIQNMTQTLVATYQLQFEQSIKDLIPTFMLKQSTLKQTIRDCATYILYIICFLFVIILLYISKIIKYKLRKEIDNLQSMIEDIVDP